VIFPLPGPGSAFKNTEKLDFVPPMTLVGLKLTETTWNGMIVSVADCFIPPYEAVMTTLCEVLTNLWLTANVTIAVVPLSLTDAPTLARLAFELVRVTVSPAEGANPLNVTVPVTGVVDPPTTVLGFKARLCSAAG